MIGGVACLPASYPSSGVRIQRMDKAEMTSATHKVSGRRLDAPKALLLDFGGVVADVSRVTGWEMHLARTVRDRLTANGIPPEPVSLTAIESDIRAGCTADSHWKNAMSRPYAPPELTYQEFWGDFVSADWPQAARKVVVSEAHELCRLMGHMRSNRQIRIGLIDLLDKADAANISVGIVSNALCGQVHVEFLEQHGLTGRFAVTIHSDAAHVRKPNPEMILLATRQLAVNASDAWYVGDNFDRDVLCGARAGIGGNILMEAAQTYDMPYDLSLLPDAIVADPIELLALLSTALGEAAA